MLTPPTEIVGAAVGLAAAVVDVAGSVAEVEPVAVVVAPPTGSGGTGESEPPPHLASARAKAASRPNANREDIRRDHGTAPCAAFRQAAARRSEVAGGTGPPVGFARMEPLSLAVAILAGPAPVAPTRFVRLASASKKRRCGRGPLSSSPDAIIEGVDGDGAIRAERSERGAREDADARAHCEHERGADGRGRRGSGASPFAGLGIEGDGRRRDLPHRHAEGARQRGPASCSLDADLHRRDARVRGGEVDGDTEATTANVDEVYGQAETLVEFRLVAGICPRIEFVPAPIDFHERPRSFHSAYALSGHETVLAVAPADQDHHSAHRQGRRLGDSISKTHPALAATVPWLAVLLAPDCGCRHPYTNRRGHRTIVRRLPAPAHRGTPGSPGFLNTFGKY